MPFRLVTNWMTLNDLEPKLGVFFVILATFANFRIAAVADSHLSFSHHISSVYRACFYHVRDLRRIHPVLDIDMASIIGTSFVHSRLDYCNFMYYCLRKSQLSGLQHTQNALARAAVAPTTSNPDHILRSLRFPR